MSKSQQDARQAAAKRRQLKDLEHKAELSRLAYESAQAEVQVDSAAQPAAPVAVGGDTKSMALALGLLAQAKAIPAGFDPGQYAVSEAWDAAQASNIIPQLAGLLGSEMYQQDAAGVALIQSCITGLAKFIASEVADMSEGLAADAAEDASAPDDLVLGPDTMAPKELADKAAGGKPGDYLVVEDPEKSTTWHLQVKKDGTPDHGLMGAAWAALHDGYRGNTYDGPGKTEAIAKLTKLYAAEKMPVPGGGKALDEKDSESLFQKFMSWVKAGARHSASDQEHLQAAHDHLAAAGAECGMKMLKALDGSYRWVGWVSNKWRDRDTAKFPGGEIISEAAHKEFVAHLDAHPDQAPEWWSWHTPVRKARADVWDYADGFLLMSGPVPAGEEKGYLDLSEPIAMSHGFFTLDRDGANGVINKYRSFEVSDLPLDRAANPWTAFDVVRKELTEMGFSKDKRDYFVKVFGEERTAALEAETAQMGKALDEAGVEAKEKAPAEAAAAVPEVNEHILEQVKTLLNTEGLQAALVELGQQNKALAEQVAELKKTEDAKIAEKIAPKVKPLQWGYQASQAKDNELTDEQKDKLKTGQSKGWVDDAFRDLVH
jgi:hypothetical protein